MPSPTIFYNSRPWFYENTPTALAFHPAYSDDTPGVYIIMTDFSCFGLLFGIEDITHLSVGVHGWTVVERSRGLHLSRYSWGVLPTCSKT